MKELFRSLYSVMLCILVSCGGAGRQNETLKAVERADSCISDPKNTYEVYVPERKYPVGKLPLLVIIDPHGSGKPALERFKQGADQYPLILVASNLIKNGFDNYEGAIEALIKDVRSKYPAGETVFMAGFSGGARMALGYAMTHRLNGLIMCGALANADQIHSLRFPVFSISGMDDFNFMETAQYLVQEQSIPGNLRIELTDASHNWPDTPTLTNAFGFLCLSSHTAESPSPAKSQLKEFCQNQHARIDSLEQQGDFLKAALVARNMSFTEPFSRDKTFASAYDDLKANSKYISQLNQLKKCLNIEISARKPYMEAFLTKDSLWWKNEIQTMDEKINTEQDSFTNDMYRRIKGFWGIACYSFCNQAVKEQNAENLKKIVTIYRMLEPENPDMLYFSAFLYFWKKDNEATLSLLKKAREAGFSDMVRLQKDFPGSITSKL